MTRSPAKPERFNRQRVLLVAAVLSVLASIGVTGCAPTTPPLATPFEPIPAFAETGTSQAPQRWWTSFEDSTLNTLVESALRDNLDLKTAWQRLREAEAIAAVVGAQRYPGLFLEIGGELQRPKANSGSNLSLGLAANYEIDLWGQIGSELDAERLRTSATRADYRTAALSLSAEVVRAWFQLTAARAQTDLLLQQVATNETSLQLLEGRFRTGQIRSADILRQRQLLEATRENVGLARTQVDVLGHRLAVLLGLPPSAPLEIASPNLPELPPLPETGLPADLVQRRPDVQSAFLQLAAADRDLAAAISARYPRLSLSGSVSTTADAPSRLFDDWLRSLAGNLLAPLFTGGELSAQVDRAEARRQQRLFEYGQSVLVAFREVEDALVEERSRLERLESLQLQTAFAEQTRRRLQLEYLNGVGGFLDVLTAQITQQQLERSLLNAQLGLLENRIALYRALAGGFEAEQVAEQTPAANRTPIEWNLPESKGQAPR